MLSATDDSGSRSLQFWGGPMESACHHTWQQPQSCTSCPCLGLCLGGGLSPRDPIHIDNFTSLSPAFCHSLHRHLRYKSGKLLWTSLLVFACMCILSLSGWQGSLCPWTSDTCYPKDLWQFISLSSQLLTEQSAGLQLCQFLPWRCNHGIQLALAFFPRPCVFIALAFRLRANFQMCLLWNRLSEGPLWG